MELVCRPSPWRSCSMCCHLVEVDTKFKFCSLPSSTLIRNQIWIKNRPIVFHSFFSFDKFSSVFFVFFYKNDRKNVCAIITYEWILDLRAKTSDHTRRKNLIRIPPNYPQPRTWWLHRPAALLGSRLARGSTSALRDLNLGTQFMFKGRFHQIFIFCYFVSLIVHIRGLEWFFLLEPKLSWLYKSI